MSVRKRRQPIGLRATNLRLTTLAVAADSVQFAGAALSRLVQRKILASSVGRTQVRKTKAR
jgi:hypothetical protein